MWAFEVTPAKLPEIYWSHALEDIQAYARLRLSWFQARAFQEYDVMRIILEQAFGSSKNSGAKEPESKEQAKNMLESMFGKK